MKKVAERVDAARHASLYRVRQEKLSRKMQELEAAKSAALELLARHK